MNSRRDFLRTAVAAGTAALVPAAAFGHVQKRTVLNKEWAVTLAPELPPNPFVITTDFGRNTTFSLDDAKLSGLCVQSVTAFHHRANGPGRDDEYHVTIDAIYVTPPKTKPKREPVTRTVILARADIAKAERGLTPRISRLECYDVVKWMRHPDLDITQPVVPQVLKYLHRVTDIHWAAYNDIFEQAPIEPTYAGHAIVDPVVGKVPMLADGTKLPLRVISTNRDDFSCVHKVTLCGVATVKFAVDIEADYWKALPVGRHTFKSFRLAVHEDGFLHVFSEPEGEADPKLFSFGLPATYGPPLRYITPRVDVNPDTVAKIRSMFQESRKGDWHVMPYPVEYQPLTPTIGG